MSQEWNKEGAWGVWKGSNATFVYNILLQTIEKWSRGLLSALLNIPDSGLNVGLDTSADLVGPYPWASLGLAIGAAAIAGIILAPLDLLRTKYVSISGIAAYTDKSKAHHNSNLSPETLSYSTTSHITVISLSNDSHRTHDITLPGLAHYIPFYASPSSITSWN